MGFLRFRIVIAALGLVAGLIGQSRAAEQPALVVVISIDQFRYDYLERFRPYFGPGGFNLLLEHGADYTDAHHRHSITKTGPGHALMLTGVHADVNGIIGNDWLDRTTFEPISCVGDKDVQNLGLPPNMRHVPGVDDPYLGRSPKNLLAPTIGDELKEATRGRSKVIGISNKHRAAILMSGRKADAAYFMEFGRMTTSTYYMKELPLWVRKWNSAGKADACFGKVWERLLPPAEYEKVQGPDDAPGEDDTTGKLGRVFPKTVTGGEAKPGVDFYDALENTPFYSELLLDFTESAVVHENLGGRKGVTDLLCLSLSANDHCGHMYGPDSQEVMDLAIRTDRMLGDFFKFLDQRVGLGKCIIVLTADHGVSPMPETMHVRHPEIPAGRIEGGRLLAACEAALNEKFGPLADKSRWLVRDDMMLRIFPSALQEKKITAAQAEDVLREAALKVDFVAAAYTRDQMERGEAPGEYGAGALLSFNRERSGDLFVQPRPYYFIRKTGSNHGSPYDYDTHVPLLWYGLGVKPGVHPEKVGTDDLAPTLAHLLGLSAPPQSRGHVLF
ncbi:MAG TPA: alkaline phosphatase family protein [Candidatus Didemnitutus sp.]|nr:alkaline phosphatase family protein [Candidatus Didemnitutus sp.]